MHRVIRPLAVFGIASGVSVAAAVQIAVAPDELTNAGTSTFFSGYDLGKLQLLGPTLYYVEESYVEPSRVDWEAMYVAGLQAIERRVPVAKFHREPGGEVLAVEIGDFRTVYDVPTVGSSKELQKEMRKVAGYLEEHLEPGDIPDVPEGVGEPLAEVEYAMVNGMLRTLDPHSLLLPPPDAKEMEVENQGEFGGLGITIVDRRGVGLTIESTMPDTPADRAGLQPEDRIVRVEGESTVNMTLDEAVSLLRGPVGTPVNVSVERASRLEPIEVTVVRQLIGLNRVEGELLEGGIGYISIKAFHDNVERDLHDILSRLHREASGAGDLRGLVLDLRGNPGGFLNQAVRVSDTFLTDGDIVSQTDGSGRRTDVERARRQAEPDYPMVVLVDASSASASEIVAGALRNHDRAVIIGERSFGKGSVQNLTSFYDDSKLKLTISKYLTPGDKSIQSVGIPADVALLPSVVEADEDEGPIVRLFHRERVRREADLDHALDRAATEAVQPALYSVRYLETQEQRGAVRPPEDIQVIIARDVLLAANGAWRRTDVLDAAGRLLQQQASAGEEGVVEAMDAIGIDWSAGPAAARRARLPVSVALDPGEEGVLVAGQQHEVTLAVTNTGEEPLYRVAAIAKDHGVLDGAEFFFGRLEPGETRTFSHDVTLPDGYASERAPVTFEVRDSGVGALGHVDAEVVVQGHELPRFAWRWAVTDASGDGIVQAGEAISVQLEVENDGGGIATGASARIRTKQRKVVEILDGTLVPGTPVDDCDPLASASCVTHFGPGERFEGSFNIQITAEDDWAGVVELDLELREESAYDHASIMRAGFYEFYGQDDHIRLIVGAPVPEASSWRRTPEIQISRAPKDRSSDTRVALSGVVEDDGGLDHVMVFAGGDKIFFEGSGRKADIRSLPFTADVELEPGENVITVLATDTDGFSSTRSVVAWRDDSELARIEP